MFRKCLLVLVLLGLLGGSGAGVQAADLNFILQDVTFEDASSASGFFQFVGTWNVAVEKGKGFSAFDYTPENSRILPVQDATVLTWYVASNDGDRGLRLVFQKPPGGVPEPGDTLPLIVADSTPASNSVSWEVHHDNGDSRLITDGFILVSNAPVPEMSTFVWLGLGLLLASAWSRRRALRVQRI